MFCYEEDVRTDVRQVRSRAGEGSRSLGGVMAAAFEVTVTE